MVKVKVRNVEVYLAEIDSPTTFLPASRGNNTTIAAYLDDAITAGTITNLTKISDSVTEVSLDPAEDDTETINYYGSTVDGAQNSSTESTANNDVDITITTNTDIVENITKFALADTGITNSTYTNYQSFNLGSTSTDTTMVFMRIARTVGSVYHYKNYLVTEPVFKKVGVPQGSADDSVLSQEYDILGNKSQTFVDFYSGSVESLSNL